MSILKLSPQQKIVVIGMVVIALLFTGATVHRAGDGDGDAATRPGAFIEWMGRQFGGPPDADRKDLSGPCLQQDRLELTDGTCTITVARSDAGQRSVRLHTDSDVAVQAPAPGRDTLVRSDAEAGSTISVAVSGDGADIDVICAGARTCVLTLVREG